MVEIRDLELTGVDGKGTKNAQIAVKLTFAGEFDVADGHDVVRDCLPYLGSKSLAIAFRTQREQLDLFLGGQRSDPRQDPAFLRAHLEEWEQVGRALETIVPAACVSPVEGPEDAEDAELPPGECCICGVREPGPDEDPEVGRLMWSNEERTICLGCDAANVVDGPEIEPSTAYVAIPSEQWERFSELIREAARYGLPEPLEEIAPPEAPAEEAEPTRWTPVVGGVVWIAAELLVSLPDEVAAEIPRVGAGGFVAAELVEVRHDLTEATVLIGGHDLVVHPNDLVQPLEQEDSGAADAAEVEACPSCPSRVGDECTSASPCELPGDCDAPADEPAREILMVPMRYRAGSNTTDAPHCKIRLVPEGGAWRFGLELTCHHSYLTVPPIAGEMLPPLDPESFHSREWALYTALEQAYTLAENAERDNDATKVLRREARRIMESVEAYRAENLPGSDPFDVPEPAGLAEAAEA